jgi:GT2 family glycosyltransferase
LDTDNIQAPTTDGTLWGNRLSAYSRYDAPGVPLCSIYIQGYNRLHKTRYAVECVLKYTTGIDYELILIDNGSSDGTFEYFQSVPFENKRVIKVTKNIGSGFPFGTVRQIYSGKYLIGISNDVYVTRNWLSNLLKCMESEPNIGFVEPLSNNVSNLQEHDLGGWKDFDEMQEKAAAFNVSDPSKWEERMRLISLLFICSRYALDGIGTSDSAFVHDFSEDDICIRLRRMGYKLVLCRDTWVCHDHDFRNMEDKDPAAFQASIESGRAIYAEKYHGIDAWDDINNYEFQLLAQIDTWTMPRGEISALCVDVRCGTPVLEIRNRLKKRGSTDVASYAFTTQAKYYLDLQTVSGEVVCDRIDFIQSHYADGAFHSIVLGEPVNIYPEPITLLQRLYNFLKPGGLLLFKLRNTDDFRAFLRSSGLGNHSDGDLPSSMPPADVARCLELFGCKDISISAEFENLSEQDRNWLSSRLKAANPNAQEEDFSRLMTKDYVFCVTKG